MYSKKILLRNLLKKFNIQFIQNYHYEIIEKMPYFLRYYSLLSFEEQVKIAKYLPYAKSQLGQDLFAYIETDKIKSNFFVEFGATDGILRSNSYLLEKKMNWRGILVEPCKIWHKNLKSNRNCIIDLRAVNSSSNEFVDFVEVPFSNQGPSELSFIKNSSYNVTPNNSKIYKVETVSLNDLLEYHNAPLLIDYLSIDTEGNEFEILSSYDFDKRKIKVITIEHNFNKKKKELINKLLTKNGYEQKFNEISLFDDWYVLKDEK